MSQDRLGIESAIHRHYRIKWFITIGLLLALFALSWFSPAVINLFRTPETGIEIEEGNAFGPALIDDEQEQQPTPQPSLSDSAETDGAVASQFGMSFTAMPGTVIELGLDGELIGRAEVGDDGVWVWQDNLGNYAASPGERSAQTAPSTLNWESLQNGQIAADAMLQLSGTSVPNGTLIVMVEEQVIAQLPIGEDGRWSYNGPLTELALGNHILVVSALLEDGKISRDHIHAIPFTVVAPAGADAETPVADTSEAANDDASSDASSADMSSDEDVADENNEIDEADSAEIGGGTLGVLEVTAQIGGLEILAEAARITGFDSSLRDGGPFTVFAPTDDAFANLPEGLTSALLSDAGAITSLLQHHVVSAELMSADLNQDQRLQTVGGTEITITALDGSILIGGAEPLSVDNIAENGVVHVIDSVLLPPASIAKPEIDSSGVAEFSGEFLTIIGSGEPESTLFVELNGVPFGQTFVGDDGSWLVAAPISTGDYEIVAYSLSNALEVAVSEPVILTVIE